MKHCITLPSGLRVTIADYVKAWRYLKTCDPLATVARWNWHGNSAAEVLGEIVAGVHDRINRHLPGFGKGRKWSSDWQRAAINTARHVNTPRLIVRWLPHDLRRRLQHRIEKAA